MDDDPAMAAALLARTPAMLRTLLLDLPEAWLDAPERAGAWSARDITCHLADLERDAWLPRAEFILEYGSSAPLPAIERERFRARYADAPFESVLNDFTRFRASNLQALHALTADERSLTTTGAHPTFGAVTLAQLLSTWLIHDLTHLAQIARALAAQYGTAVGPWRELLSVLRVAPAGR